MRWLCADCQQHADELVDGYLCPGCRSGVLLDTHKFPPLADAESPSPQAGVL